MTSPDIASDGLLWLYLRGEPLPEPPKAKKPEKPVGVRFKPGFGPNQDDVPDANMDINPFRPRREEEESSGFRAGRDLRRALGDDEPSTRDFSITQLPEALAGLLQGCGAHVELSLDADPLSDTWRFRARISVGRDQELWYETRLSSRDAMYRSVIRDTLRDMNSRIREAIRDNTRIEIR